MLGICAFRNQGKSYCYCSPHTSCFTTRRRFPAFSLIPPLPRGYQRFTFIPLPSFVSVHCELALYRSPLRMQLQKHETRRNEEMQRGCESKKARTARSAKRAPLIVRCGQRRRREKPKVSAYHYQLRVRNARTAVLPTTSTTTTIRAYEYPQATRTQKPDDHSCSRTARTQ
jgi:hypothetical protein